MLNRVGDATLFRLTQALDMAPHGVAFTTKGSPTEARWVQAYAGRPSRYVVPASAAVVRVAERRGLVLVDGALLVLTDEGRAFTAQTKRPPDRAAS